MMPDSLLFSNKSHRFPFNTPKRSADLAEFCGIMLGDGGISPYQIAITLHSIDDYDYGIFVANLIQRLFDLNPGTYMRKSALAFSLVISRKALVEFLSEECGLPIGNKVKARADIPNWIKENESYRIACVRGLVDTDGSVFEHRYLSKRKRYSYKKLSFTSASEPLLHSVFEILNNLNFAARIGKAQDVRIDSKSDMARYFKIIGSHNPKHLKRFAS